MPDDHRERIDRLAKELSDQGRLIEAGWIALRELWLSPNTPPDKAKALRWAFMAGSQHLFASIISILDPGEEPTDKDLKRIDLIHAELETFRKEMEADLPTRGRA
jgi:hypothetical protein